MIALVVGGAKSGKSMFAQDLAKSLNESFKMEEYMKNKKKFNAYDIGIIFSIIGIVAGILVIVVNSENKTNGIASICTCSVILSACIRYKKSNK